MLAGSDGAAHPVTFAVEPAYASRRRLSGGLRLLFALPHLLFTGGPSLLGMVVAPVFVVVGLAPLTVPLSIGAFGVLALLTTIASWIALLVRGRQPRGLREVATWFLGWRANAIAYAVLLRDEFPPFGYGDYEAHLAIPPQPERRDRVSIALRLPLLLPHLPVLVVLNVLLTVVSVIAWLTVTLGGRYPAPLYDFTVGAVRYSLRVEAYLLLLHDTWPPLRLD